MNSNFIQLLDIHKEFEEGGKMRLGVCGADADVIVARNFGRFVAGGSAGHSDHGRDLIEVLEAIVEGKTQDYQIKDGEIVHVRFNV